MWIFASLLALAGGLLYRRRLLGLRARITDEDIDQLIRGERTSLPGGSEPLDIEEIREAEREFWEEEAWRGKGKELE